jgi:hypothetical protein
LHELLERFQAARRRFRALGPLRDDRDRVRRLLCELVDERLQLGVARVLLARLFDEDLELPRGLRPVDHAEDDFLQRHIAREDVEVLIERVPEELLHGEAARKGAEQRRVQFSLLSPR